MSSSFWTDENVAAALDVQSGTAAGPYRAVSTDTRTVGEGDLFLALVGEKFDGHDFIEKATSAGATGVVVSRDVEVPNGVAVYRVADTLTALQKLAHHRRMKHPARIIGIVGSNGKTTTKELVRAVLSSKYRTHATSANLNNQIGVPQTLLSIPEDAQFGVVEMGTDRPGEIAILTAVVSPDTLVITSIGEEHLELLGDLEGVLQEEISSLEGLKAEGNAYVAEEPATLPRAARELIGRNRVKVAGFRGVADLRPDGGESTIRYMEDGSTLWRWRGLDVRLPIPGKLNVRNALLALGVGLEMGVPSGEAVRALQTVNLPGLRGQWMQYGNVRVLADCYNANPPSVAAAVDLIGRLPVRGRRVVVLGTMRELGAATADLHASSADLIADEVNKGSIDMVVATGEFAEAFKDHKAKLGNRLVIEKDPIEAYGRAKSSLQATDTILLKASRGDQMERWLPLLEADFGEDGGTE